MSDTPATDELRIEQRGAVLWLTIAREARRNAVSHAVLAAMARAIDAAQSQREIRAIVITGAGDKAFCAGADLQADQAFTTDYSEPQGHVARVLRAAKASNVPLIARVNGACMAGGMGLLAMCDLAVAAPHARFGLPEVGVGVFPAQVLSVLQPLVPRRLLMQWCLTGEAFDAGDALAAGLLNHVDADLDGRVQWLLDQLLSRSPAAIRRGRYTMKAVQSLPFEESLRFTESQITLFALTEDAREGMAAFRERRAPNWSGR